MGIPTILFRQQSGTKNIIREALVPPSKFLLPPFHFKLGPMKQFVRTLNKEDDCYLYIRKVFLNTQDAKLREAIFDKPKIRKTMR